MNLLEISQLLSDYPTRELKKNETLYQMGDEPTAVYFVIDGLLGLFHLSLEGKETFLRVFGKNSILGHRSFFAQQPYHANAVALTKSKIITIPKSDCDKICASNPNFLKSIVRPISKDLADAELRLAGLKDKTANTRIAESLLFLKYKYPSTVWTRKEIAEYSCSSLESVARLMTKLEEHNIIQKIGRDYSIEDKDALLDLPESLK